MGWGSGAIGGERRPGDERWHSEGKVLRHRAQVAILTKDRTRKGLDGGNVGGRQRHVMVNVAAMAGGMLSGYHRRVDDVTREMGGPYSPPTRTLHAPKRYSEINGT